MNLSNVEKDMQHRENILKNLECTLFYLKQKNIENPQSIDLILHQIFFIKDQLFKYNILLNLLRDESDDKMLQANI